MAGDDIHAGCESRRARQRPGSPPPRATVLISTDTGSSTLLAPGSSCLDTIASIPAPSAGSARRPASIRSKPTKTASTHTVTMGGIALGELGKHPRRTTSPSTVCVFRPSAALIMVSDHYCRYHRLEVTRYTDDPTAHLDGWHLFVPPDTPALNVAPAHPVGREDATVQSNHLDAHEGLETTSASNSKTAVSQRDAVHTPDLPPTAVRGSQGRTRADRRQPRRPRSTKEEMGKS
ncbi:uncharacterized protein PSFLO_01394 [Pseudozyma flocculosa]|uniref:Uncharacterized protein n=1 Tax=Pseudozyma flocculosa TaxID=84751 RepID=A0A5C3EU99_9BASI|nr:uncharacterized protein PSFLO_01394 [Pseudozyma flocculosa]